MSVISKEIIYSLESYSAFFSAFFEVANVNFYSYHERVKENKNLSAVPEVGYIYFQNDKYTMEICREFWETATLNMKKFVLVHESLHAMLDHFSRFENFLIRKDQNDAMVANIAMDMAINQHIVSEFGISERVILRDFATNKFMFEQSEKEFEEKKKILMEKHGSEAVKNLRPNRRALIFPHTVFNKEEMKANKIRTFSPMEEYLNLIRALMFKYRKKQPNIVEFEIALENEGEGKQESENFEFDFDQDSSDQGRGEKKEGDSGGGKPPNGSDDGSDSNSESGEKSGKDSEGKEGQEGQEGRNGQKGKKESYKKKSGGNSSEGEEGEAPKKKRKVRNVFSSFKDKIRKMKPLDSHESSVAKEKEENQKHGEYERNNKKKSFMEEVERRITEKISSKEADNFVESLKRMDKNAGNTPIGEIIEVGKFIKNQSFERKAISVAKRVVKTAIDKLYKEVDTFSAKNLRFHDHENYFVPGFREQIDLNRKVRLCVFVDTSGSCVSMATDFMNTLKSLPKNIFEVEAYCFDTELYKVENYQVRGHGGTDFDPMVDLVEKEMKKKPNLIFVVTDGYASTPSTKISRPNRWHWFLTKCGTDYYVPKDCNIHKGLV